MNMPIAANPRQVQINRVWQALERNEKSCLCATYLDELVPVLSGCVKLLRLLGASGASCNVNLTEREDAGQISEILNDLLKAREIKPYKEVLLERLGYLKQKAPALFGGASEAEQVYSIVANEITGFYTLSAAAPLNAICSSIKGAFISDARAGKVTILLKRLIETSRTAFSSVNGQQQPKEADDADYVFAPKGIFPDRLEITGFAAKS